MDCALLSFAAGKERGKNAQKVFLRPGCPPIVVNNGRENDIAHWRRLTNGGYGIQ